MSRKIRLAGPALEVELNHVQGADARFATRPQTDEETGNHGQVDFHGDALRAVRQQMTATEDAFEPAEKQFHGPTKTVAQGNQLGSESEAAGHQQEDFRTA